MKRILASLCLLTFMVPAALAQMPDTTQFRACSYTGGGETLLYRIYQSPAVSGDDACAPLVLFLHGAGERGNDNVSQLLNCMGGFVTDSIATRFPFRLVVPQCPEEVKWVDTDWTLLHHDMLPEPTTPLRLALDLVDMLVSLHLADPSQIYVCGLSMGGFGTWEALQRRPDLFAAAIPICGGGDPAYAARLVDIPIRAFHGEDDTVVHTSRTRDMEKAVIDAGGKKLKAKYYPGTGHGSWVPAFREPGILAWLFSNRK